MQNLSGADGAQEISYRISDAFWFQTIENAVPFPALGHQISAFEDRQMAGHGRARDSESGDDLSGREFALFEFLEDLPAGRVRQSPENAGGRFHDFNLSYFAK